jgi:hypothetical protein
MHETADQKEKVLNMLLEINSQLEELEKVLQSSFSNHRNELQIEQGTVLDLCEKRVKSIEQTLGAECGNTRGREDSSLNRKQMELKLGF